MYLLIIMFMEIYVLYSKPRLIFVLTNNRSYRLKSRLFVSYKQSIPQPGQSLLVGDQISNMTPRRRPSYLDMLCTGWSLEKKVCGIEMCCLLKPFVKAINGVLDY